MRIDVIDATTDSIGPFAQIGLTMGAEPTARLPGMDFWADVIALPPSTSAFGIGVATQEPRPAVQEQVERHMQTTELLIATGGSMVVVLGRPDFPGEPDRLPGLDRFAAFRIPAGIPVVLHPGVWHWAPFAVDSPISLTVGFKKGTSADDSHVCTLPEALTF